jgi:hypothetical protein
MKEEEVSAHEDDEDQRKYEVDAEETIYSDTRYNQSSP